MAGIAIACAALAAAAVAAGGGSVGTIAFSASLAPKLQGEVMRLGADGTTVDLSKSPALDSAASVSPDGTKVAFFSTRGGRDAEYVVETNGTHLRRVSPYLHQASPNDVAGVVVAWSSGGASFAALQSSYGSGPTNVYLASPAGGVWRALTKSRDQADALAGWSPNGKELAYVSNRTGSLRVVDLRGRVLLDAPGTGAWWSQAGRLAVQRSSGIVDVYGASLKRIATVAAAFTGWSPAGALATITSTGLLQVRRGGVGKPLLSRRVGAPAQVTGANFTAVRWLDARRLRVFGENGFFEVDTRTGHTFLLAGAFAAFDSVTSPDGTTALGEVQNDAKLTSSLFLSTLGGGTKTLASTDVCGVATGYENLALLPDGSVVYDTAACYPSSDIYSVGGDGAGLVQLTKTPTDETQPALSPGATKIAYVTRLTAAGCQGCKETISAMNADGTGARAFPNSSDPDVEFDDSPSFSPDGTQILFSRSGPSTAGLLTEPAAGGPVHALGVSGLAPVWGPIRIVYDDQQRGLVTAGPTGRNAVPLKLDGVPAWSPSGRLALLHLDQKGALSILFADTKGSIKLPGLHSAFGGGGLAWSPDGTRLAFVAADDDGVGDIWTIGADGTGLTRLTHDLGAGGTLSWR